MSGGERKSPLARDSWAAGALSAGRVQGCILALPLIMSCGNWDITFLLGASPNSGLSGLYEIIQVKLPSTQQVL